MVSTARIAADVGRAVVFEIMRFIGPTPCSVLMIEHIQRLLGLNSGPCCEIEKFPAIVSDTRRHECCGWSWAPRGLARLPHSDKIHRLACGPAGGKPHSGDNSPTEGSAS
jgi:hypothetical protein